ncbi:MAG: 2-phosphosulfolactate phosphatase [Bacteroidia bacterium]
MTLDQQEFDIRLEWGLKGVEELAPVSDVVVIVDILSFSTCVDIATSRGAIIYPYRWKDESAIEYAQSLNAALASFQRNATDEFSLSPTSLQRITAKTTLVLPSPNGSTLSLATGSTPTLCGSLRNAKSVARLAQEYGNKISIIAAGEQWPDKTLRPSFEDLVGAGSIISYLAGSLSPESKAGLAVFRESVPTILSDIQKCSSGKELIERGFEHDIFLACELNSSQNVPVLTDGRFVSHPF